MVSDPIDGDPELRAMGQVLEVLSPLDPAMRLRVLHWVTAKLEIPAAAHTAPVSQQPRSSSYDGGARETLREGTVSTVAIKLGADSCRTLMIAAAVHLTLYQGKDAFSRAEWIACAREARPWKADYNSQIPTIIGRLQTSSVIFEKSKDVFSADTAFLAEQEERLAG